MKTRVIITGMHRSGTSMLSGVLGIIGLEIGNSFRKNPRFDNPKGYFEDMQFMSINKTLMRECGIGPGSFNIPRKYNIKASQKTDAMINKFLNFWKRMSFPQGWKDPRACLTLGIWKQRVKGLKVITIHRPQIEILNSLKTRSKNHAKSDSIGFPTHKMINVIKHYSERLEFNCKGLERLTLQHHDFFNPAKLPNLLLELRDFVGLEDTIDYEAAIDFIDRSLWRERQSMRQEMC
jgi:hypothetical protein